MDNVFDRLVNNMQKIYIAELEEIVKFTAISRIYPENENDYRTLLRLNHNDYKATNDMIGCSEIGKVMIDMQKEFDKLHKK